MDFAFSGEHEHQKIELFVSCRKLVDRDLISKSDPYVSFYMKDRTTGNFVLHGNTETVRDNLNPNFTKTFIVDFIFEVKQECKFEVWDYDSERKADFLGSAITTIGEIAGSKGQILILNLQDINGKQIKSKIIIRTEKVSHSTEKYVMALKAEQLSSQSVWVNLVSQKCPFFIIYKSREDSTWLKVYESTVIMDNKNPHWKAFEIYSGKINEGDHLRPFKIEIWNWKKSGTHKYLGECLVTVDNLVKKEWRFELKNPHKPEKKGKVGYLVVEDFSLTMIPEFFDYLRSGLQLNFILAIDFTGSNGVPQKPDSLHAIKTDGTLNHYQEAIEKVGEIILNYDYDKMIPVFGFGAKPHFPGLFQPTVSHCFPLSGDPNQTEVYGLQGIFDIYTHAMNYIDFSGPTLIHPIIECAKSLALECKNLSKSIYNILLILTDGEIYELDTTITSIIESSDLPLSIIIVGIGNSDFGKLVTLDGDDGLINRAGVKAKRDLVQFVPFREFNGNGSALAEKVLEEVPEQVIKYMMSMGKMPGKAVDIDVEKMLKRMESERQSILNIRSYSQDIKNRLMPAAGIYSEASNDQQGMEYIMPRAQNFDNEDEEKKFN